MKQITREQYEVLKDLVPTEIKYYAELPQQTNGNGRAAPAPRRPRNQLVHLTTLKPDAISNSITGRIYSKISSALDKDPTKIIGRADLTKIVHRMDKGLKKSTVSRTIGKFIDDGVMATAD